jgi:hypothetical protein
VWLSKTWSHWKWPLAVDYQLSFLASSTGFSMIFSRQEQRPSRSQQGPVLTTGLLSHPPGHRPRPSMETRSSG